MPGAPGGSAFRGMGPDFAPRCGTLSISAAGMFSVFLCGVDHRQGTQCCAMIERRCEVRHHVRVGITCESMSWSACAWHQTVCNWQATLIALICVRISFGWRGYGPPWRIGTRADRAASADTEPEHWTSGFAQLTDLATAPNAVNFIQTRFGWRTHNFSDRATIARRPGRSLLHKPRSPALRP